MERGIYLALRLWELPGWYRGLRVLLDPVRISSSCGAVQFSRRARSWHSALSVQATEEQKYSPPSCTAMKVNKKLESRKEAALCLQWLNLEVEMRVILCSRVTTDFSREVENSR